MEFILYTLEFNYVIVGRVNDRSRKIEAGCAFRDVCILERPGQLDVRDTWRYEMRKNCSRAATYLVGIGLSIAGQGRANCVRERFSLALGNTCQSVSRILTLHVILYPLVSGNSSNRAVSARYSRPRRPPRHRRSVARARRHIGNSVSTIIPRMIRKRRGMRGSV